MSSGAAPIDAPYPSDTLAKGWRFEIDLERVERSDTWIRAKSGAVRGALLLLWSRAWMQTPCGTLPNDDELVSLLIDMSESNFAKQRTVLMRGWTLATDGRLYHETITDRVLSMIEKRKSDALRAAARRVRAVASKESHAAITDASRVTNTVPTGEFDTKHQAPSTSKTPKAPIGADGRFESFWAAYPKKVGKDAAAKAFAKRKPDEAMLAAMLAAVSSQASSVTWAKDGGQFIPNPATWLNQGRWQDGETMVSTGQWAGAI